MSEYAIDSARLLEQGRVIESNFDVSSLRFLGEPVWNTLRVLLLGTHNWTFSRKGTVEKAQRRRAMPILDEVRNLQKHIRRDIPYKAVEVGYSTLYIDENTPVPADVLYFDALDLLRVDNEGKITSRILRDFDEHLSDHTVLSITLHNRAFETAIFRHPTVLFARPPDSQIYGLEPHHRVTHLDDLLRFMRDRNLACPHTEDQLQTWVRGIYARSESFRPLLEIFAPKLVLLTSFKSSERMALIRACRQVGVATVEAQHGILGPEYQELSWVEPGQDWIPDAFWLWGQQSCSHMAPPPGKTGPLLLNGTNFDLLRGLRSLPPEPEPESESQVPTILFIEQYTHSHTARVIQTVAQGLEKLGIRAQFRLRLHPRSLHLKRTLAADLRAKKLEVDIDQASSEPLYATLRAASVVIVESSTVAYEASALGRPVVVYGDVAGKFFERDIRSGAFFFAETVEQIAQQIQRARSTPTRPSDFFNTDRESILLALSKLRALIAAS